MPGYTQFVYATNTTANHNKYYVMALRQDRTGYGVVFHWGKIGTAGQYQLQTFSSSYLASNFIQDKIAEKKAKGYIFTTKIPNNIISDMNIYSAGFDGRIISQTNKDVKAKEEIKVKIKTKAEVQKEAVAKVISSIIDDDDDD